MKTMCLIGIVMVCLLCPCKVAEAAGKNLVLSAIRAQTARTEKMDRRMNLFPLGCTCRYFLNLVEMFIIRNDNTKVDVPILRKLIIALLFKRKIGVSVTLSVV